MRTRAFAPRRRRRCPERLSTLAACSGGGGIAREALGHQSQQQPLTPPGRAAKSCADPNIPMAEWRKLACDTATPSASTAPSAVRGGRHRRPAGPRGHGIHRDLGPGCGPGRAANPGSAFAAPQSGDRFVAIGGSTIANTGTRATYLFPSLQHAHRRRPRPVAPVHGRPRQRGPRLPRRREDPGRPRPSAVISSTNSRTPRGHGATVRFDGATSRPTGPWKLT
ncbi:hypothetical protein ACU686_07705 [Yinghuangia aomiensis]